MAKKNKGVWLIEQSYCNHEFEALRQVYRSRSEARCNKPNSDEFGVWRYRVVRYIPESSAPTRKAKRK